MSRPTVDALEALGGDEHLFDVLVEYLGITNLCVQPILVVVDLPHLLDEVLPDGSADDELSVIRTLLTAARGNGNLRIDFNNQNSRHETYIVR